MREIGTATHLSSAPPEAFARRWASHKATADGGWDDRQWLFMAGVHTTYRAVGTPDGGTRVSAAVTIGGLLQGLWSRVLGQRMRAGLPAHLEREVAAVERDRETV